jgi:hypothetical protein
MPSHREARLREENAEQYPDLTPGVWVPAHVLVEFVLERGLYQRRVGTPSRARPLEETHFEFRGDVTAPEIWDGVSERRDDASS